MKRTLAAGIMGGVLALAGCGSGAAQPSNPPAAPQPSASPVVSMTCTLAYWDDTSNKWYGSAVTPPDTDVYDPHLQPEVFVSLSASASQSVTVSAIQVIYYSDMTQDPASEVGSGSAYLGQTLVPGAALTSQPNDGNNAPAGAESCSAPSYNS